MIRRVGSDGRVETGGVFRPIPRPRIVERIAAAAHQRVVLLVAPAGYGKSVALSQFLAELDEPWLRFDLRPEHNTLPGVLRGLSEAIEQAAPEARATLAVAYERNRASTTPGADLAIWMQQHLKAYRGTIAIDDLHIAEGDPEVVRFLVALINRTKAHIRWIISTRTAVGLPIGSWLAYDDCDLAIDDHELQFTIEEAREAAAAFKLGVRDEELRELIDLTDGWPTALSFALRSSTRSVELRGITTMTREMIYDYLAEQVYRSLTDEERAFLEAAALLSEIDVEAMTAIGFDNARRLITDLRERVAFIHETSPGIFRCHDLFRDFLFHQLAREGETAMNRLRCKVASSLEEIGRVHAPLRLYIEAGAEASVFRLLSEHGFELLNTGHVDLAVGALGALSAEHRESDAIALALRGMIEAGAGRFKDAELLFERSVTSSSDATLRATVTLRLALLLVNQHKESAPLIDRVIEDTAIPQNLLAEALALRAIVAARVGDAERANALLDRVDDVTEYFVEDESLARTRQRAGVAAWELRQEQRARYALAQSAAICNRLSLHSLGCRALDILALETRYCENDLKGALWYAQQALNAAGKSGDIFDMQTETLRMLGLELWRGDGERVATLERQAADYATTAASRDVYIVESRAYRSLWDGRFAEAHRGFSAILERVENLEQAFNVVLVRALCAFSLSLDGEFGRAKEQVALLIREIEQQEPKRDGFASLEFEISLLLAALAEAICGRHAIATRILARDPLTSHFGAQALREAVLYLCRAASNGAQTPYEMLPLIRALEESSLGGFGRVLVLAKEALERALEGKPVKLTEAERQVLVLLAAGMSRQQIAEETGRSILTIHTHIKHAIAKLGCRGAEQAVISAQKRGLLA
jgi:ATP/maltotriose-dependent transcriptional regulator MalT